MVLHNQHEDSFESIFMTSALKQVHRDHASWTTGAVLLNCVLGLLVFHTVLGGLRAPDESWDTFLSRLYGTFHIGAEGSVSESFNHGMAFAAAVLFFVAGKAVQSRVCMVLAALMAFAWFDDSAQYHERVGVLFQDYFATANLGIVRPVDAGGLLAWGSVGLVLLGLAVWASRRFQPGDRVVIRLVRVPVLMLVLCVSVIDLIHSRFDGTVWDATFLVIEDGGEMIAIALLATVALFLARNATRLFDEARRA